MVENTSIEWTEHTYNPWIGCTRVSPACDHCYAAVSTPSRAMGVKWGAGEERHRTSESTRLAPLRWDRAAAAAGRRDRVFCSSLADVFDNEVPLEWRKELFALIRRTPNLIWLLLTKRIGNAERMMAMADVFGTSAPPTNVWLGATIANREEMLRDAPKLQRTYAAIRFWSVEPMLGDLGDIPDWLLPDWVICGGESGRDARPINPDWVKGLLDQCEDARVPFLFKQWGEYLPRHVETVLHTGYVYDRVGKKAAGRRLFGRTYDGVPA